MNRKELFDQIQAKKSMLCVGLDVDFDKMPEHVKALAHNKIAREVKIADLRHNSDLTRLDTIDERALERVKKYKSALTYLLSMEE